MNSYSHYSRCRLVRYPGGPKGSCQWMESHLKKRVFDSPVLGLKPKLDHVSPRACERKWWFRYIFGPTNHEVARPSISNHHYPNPSQERRISRYFTVRKTTYPFPYPYHPLTVLQNPGCTQTSAKQNGLSRVSRAQSFYLQL